MYICQMKNKKLLQSIILAVMCAAVCMGIAVMMMYPGHNWGGDFSQYIAQTRALVNGDIESWYEKNLFIIEHSSDGLGSSVYPWGLSLILAPFYAVFGENIRIFKFLIILFLTGTVAVSFLYFQRKMPNLPAVLLTLLIALNPVYLISTASVQSDIPCVFFSMLSVICVDLHLKSEQHHVRNALLTGVFILMAVQMRTMSMALLLALFCTDFILGMYWLIFIRREKDIWNMEGYYHARWCYHVLPYIVYGTGDFVIHLFLPKAGETYWDYFSISFQNIKNMIKNYSSGFEEMFGGFVWIFLILGILGMIYAFRQEMFCVIYVLGTVATLLIYHYYQRSRFLFAIFPILLMFGYYGVRLLCSLIPKKAVYAASLLCASLALGGYVRQLLMEEIPLRRGIDEPIEAYSTDAMSVYGYINDHLDDDSIIYFFKPRVLYLNTNVYSYTGNNDASTLKQAEYVLFWCNDFQDEIRKAVIDNENYQLIYQNNQFLLYECLSGERE